MKMLRVFLFMMMLASLVAPCQAGSPSKTSQAQVNLSKPDRTKYEQFFLEYKVITPENQSIFWGTIEQGGELELNLGDVVDQVVVDVDYVIRLAVEQFNSYAGDTYQLICNISNGNFTTRYTCKRTKLASYPNK